MKTKILITVLTAVFFFSFTPSRAISPSTDSDSLGIISYGGAYFVYAKNTKVEVSNSELRIPYIASLKFIDPRIPEDLWTDIYLKKSLVYREGNEDPISLKVENWIPKLFVTHRKSTARLINGQILSVTAVYEIESMMGKSRSGVVFVGFMFFLGLLFGFASLLPIQGGPYTTHAGLAGFVIIIGLACFFFMGKTLTALLLPLAFFLLGFAVIQGIYQLGKKLKKNKRVHREYFRA